MDHCPGCQPLTYAASEHEDHVIDWIQCDACHQWWHALCATVDDPSEFRTWFCYDCASLHGPATSKGLQLCRKMIILEKRKVADRTLQVDAVPSYKIDLKKRLSAFASICKESHPFEIMDAQNLNKEWFSSGQFDKPVIVRDSGGLDMVMPESTLTIRDIARLLGEDCPIEVMDVETQSQLHGWTISTWADYVDAVPRRQILNVISLEISDTDFGRKLKRPRIVEEIDLVHRAWPKTRILNGDYPKVQLYCLMGIDGSYTDFHIDFNGTSVFYHVVNGKKRFLFIPPTPENLSKYQKWCKSAQQSELFFANLAGPCSMVELIAGETMFIPTGWIHAVHTLETSVVFGGNFLHAYNMRGQLQITVLEDRIQVPDVFRFPKHDELYWYVALMYGSYISKPINVSICERDGLLAVLEYLTRRLSRKRHSGNGKHAVGVPDCIQRPTDVLSVLSMLLMDSHPHGSAAEGKHPHDATDSAQQCAIEGGTKGTTPVSKPLKIKLTAKHPGRVSSQERTMLLAMDVKQASVQQPHIVTDEVSNGDQMSDEDEYTPEHATSSHKQPQASKRKAPGSPTKPKLSRLQKQRMLFKRHAL